MRVAAIMVTYRRPEDAKSTARALFSQSRPPDHLWVVDNEPSDSLAHFFGDTDSVTYLPQSTNGGPAGGIAAGMHAALDVLHDSDWLLLVDDDDPPSSPDVIEHLVALTNQADHGRVAGVGLTGARYDHRLGVVRRVPDHELSGLLEVDYIAGNQFPMYSISAVREAGLFDSELFFGFEELEYGLRLRLRSWRLLIDGQRALAQRRSAGRLGLGLTSPRRRDMPSWRKYYSARNLLVIARRYGGPAAPLAVFLGAGVLGTLRSLTEHDPLGSALTPFRGVLHGFNKTLGKTVEPGSK